MDRGFYSRENRIGSVYTAGSYRYVQKGCCRQSERVCSGVCTGTPPVSCPGHQPSGTPILDRVLPVVPTGLHARYPSRWLLPTCTVWDGSIWIRIVDVCGRHSLFCRQKRMCSLCRERLKSVSCVFWGYRSTLFALYMWKPDWLYYVANGVPIPVLSLSGPLQRVI